MANLHSHPRDPLHGVTLETIVTKLHEAHGWEEMWRRIPARCFEINPSVKSSLTFLRKTPWARARVEGWYAHEMRQGMHGAVVPVKRAVVRRTKSGGDADAALDTPHEC
jgi:uncharacterized protein (DUF2132 family)